MVPCRVRYLLTQIITESVALTLAAGSAGIVFAVFLLNIFEKATGGTAAFQIPFNTAVIAALLLAVHEINLKS